MTSHFKVHIWPHRGVGELNEYDLYTNLKTSRINGSPTAPLYRLYKLYDIHTYIIHNWYINDIDQVLQCDQYIRQKDNPCPAQYDGATSHLQGSSEICRLSGRLPGAQTFWDWNLHSMCSFFVPFLFRIRIRSDHFFYVCLP